jgi:transcriptional regulator with XRE-family HTH domain
MGEEGAVGSISVGFYANELRRARKLAGLTQEQLAEKIQYSASMVAMVENARRAASMEFSRRCDEVLDTEGLLGRILEHLITKDAMPEWFRPWVLVEQEATNLWTYEVVMVPGLLQTEGYARALLDDDDGQVMARLDRQKLLARKAPPAPTIVTLLDERVLRHPVGDREVMREQLEHLASSASRGLTVQIVPDAPRTAQHLDGSFVIATLEGSDVVYVEAPEQGLILSDPDVVGRFRRRWDIIRSEALPVGQSITLMLEAARQWSS